MSDDMALFFIIIGVVLVFIYKRSKRSVYGNEIPLGPGDYRIGEDLDPGKGDLVAVNGTGDICIKERGNDVWNNPFKLGKDNPAVPNRYRNLTLHPSDILQINGKVKLLIEPPTPIADVKDAELTLGTYQFGVDVPPAKYDLKATSGTGQVTFFAPNESEFSFYQDMGADADGKAVTVRRQLGNSVQTLRVPLPAVLTVTREVNVPRLPSIAGGAPAAEEAPEIPMGGGYSALQRKINETGTTEGLV